MNDNEARALGMRWLEAGGPWRLRMKPGNRPFATVVGVPTGGLYVHTASGIRFWDKGNMRHAWPDFRDGATRGAALEWLRERLGAEWAHPAQLRSGDWVMRLSFGLTWAKSPRASDEAKLYPLAAEALREKR